MLPINFLFILRKSINCKLISFLIETWTRPISATDVDFTGWCNCNCNYVLPTIRLMG